MAQRVVTTVVYTDDLTGEELLEGDAETINYSIDGVAYEIDLSHENAKEMRDALSRYLGRSRRTTPVRMPSKGGSRRSRAEMAVIRKWGQENGYTVPESGKGRIPWGMTQAYDRAMAKDKQN